MAEVAEYESQLASIDELLAASPADESLLALKIDLVELLQLTKSGAAAGEAAITEPTTEEAVPAGATSEEPELSLPPPPALPPQLGEASESATTVDAAIAAGTSTAASAEGDEPEVATGKRKVKKLKDFVVPPHLIVNEQDSEAEIKKKRRSLKALKSQHRERKKEVESAQKQKSWQSFQKKKGGGGSMFRTQESTSDRVGVISKKTKTEFGQRKRHKHL